MFPRVLFDRFFRIQTDSLVLLLASVVILGGYGSPALAQESSGGVSGHVADQLGGALSATVHLVQNDAVIRDAETNARGLFRFPSVPVGRYRITAERAGFQPMASALFYVGASVVTEVDLALVVGPLAQHVVVTAAATDLPDSQSGAPVSVIPSDDLRRLSKSNVLETIRLVPAAAVVQTGGRGGRSSIFIRGGASNFNKVLIDGIPANDIGGSFDWEAVSASGVDRVEVLRTANSVQYGADSLSGVISLTTPRGSTLTPSVTYSLDGGNFGTVRNAVSAGGVLGRLDYFADISRFDTDNQVSNNAYENTTVAGQIGLRLGTATDLSVSMRHVATDYGAPNAVAFYGMSDDSIQGNDLEYVSASVKSQLTNHLHTTIQFGSVDRRFSLNNRTPTGEAFDPFGFGANYLGNEVTIAGANGYETTGRAILDYGGVYPSIFDAMTSRQFLSGRANYYVNDTFDIAGGVRIEREQGGVTLTTPTSQRTNTGSFVEARASLANRIFATAGVGIEKNGLFGVAVVPRGSLAVYARPPAASGQGVLGETKFVVNIGRGIKAPSVFNEQSQLFKLIGDLPNGTELIGEFKVAPIGPERSRNVDIGIEQTLAGRRIRLRASYFDNVFNDLVEYVNSGVLPQLGVPADIAAAVPFGATVNASSYTARGIETSVDAYVDNFRIVGSYTRLNAEVTKSFSSGALTPAINPTFPGIEIGQFTPLVGARPFGRPRNMGRLMASYIRGRGHVTFTGYFAGKSDGSTFLSDAFFGTSMLLPNRDLNDRHQKLDLSGSYRLHRSVTWYLSIENLLNQGYQATLGFPGLSRSIRTGMTVALGGDSF